MATTLWEDSWKKPPLVVVGRADDEDTVVVVAVVALDNDLTNVAIYCC